MAYKAKITAIDRSGQQVTVSYQVLNDGDAVVEDNQSLAIQNGDPSLSEIKMRLISAVKLIEKAVDLKTKLDPYVDASIPVD
jgi:hypothetical protein